MRWIARLLGSVLCVASGLVAIGLVAESRFGGSVVGFFGLVAVLLLVGLLLGYTFTRLGEGSIRRSTLLGVLYAGPMSLFTFGVGRPPVVLPVLPLLFASCVLGGAFAVRRRPAGPNETAP